ncbi:MAG: hypothetical protein GY711_06655 [bacterium]|nr:hypothetical protein [bacterium]
MKRSALTLSVLSLAAFGWQQPQHDQAYLLLKEERMVLEYTHSTEEAVVLIEAESETPLARVELRSPDGSVLYSLRTGSGRGMQGFDLESSENELTGVLSAFAEGEYSLRGRTIDGQPIVGSATISHDMLRPPVVTYPYDGATDVPTSGWMVTWIEEPDAIGYQVILEQGETDGIRANLPPGNNSFEVPQGILESGTESHVEVGVIAPNGNTTLVEIEFTTQ